MLSAGSQYTFWLTAYPHNSVRLGLGNNNPYPGGVAWDETPTTIAVKDVCGKVIPTPTPVRSGTYDANGCEGTIVYTYKYIDCAGLSSDWVYTYTVERKDFEMPQNMGTEIACAADATTPTPPPVTDNCGMNIEPTGPVISDDPVCNGAKTYTYTYTDCEGNAHEWVYTYTIVKADFTMPENESSNVTCVANAVPPVLPVIHDNCNNVLEPSDPVISEEPEGLGQLTYTYTYTDCAGHSHDWVHTYNITGVTISGSFRYYASPFDPMLLTVELKQGGIVKKSVQTVNGMYAFTGVPSGTYEVVATSLRESVGGINATDAAQVNFWGTFGNSYPIEKVRFNSGDVDNELSLTSNDAAMIQGYFLTAGTAAFARTPWSFWKAGEVIGSNPGTSGNPVITVTCAPINQDFYGLVTGDFNGSYSGLKSGVRTLQLKEGESRIAGENAALDLPVIASTGMNVGAISLIMEFPSDRIAVDGVYLGGSKALPVQYSIDGNELRISWYSLQSIQVKAGEALLTLSVRTIGTVSDDELRFRLDASPLNEIADKNYQVIRNASLQIGSIKSSPVLNGGKLSLGDLTLTNFPNPFTNNTNFAYTLPAKGKVVLEVRDVLGRIIKEVVLQSQTEGNHLIALDASTMTSGLYYATVRLITENGKVLSQTIKIVSTK
jgi:hypothetical protein